MTSSIPDHAWRPFESLANSPPEGELVEVRRFLGLYQGQPVYSNGQRAQRQGSDWYSESWKPFYGYLTEWRPVQESEAP